MGDGSAVSNDTPRHHPVLRYIIAESIVSYFLLRIYLFVLLPSTVQGANWPNNARLRWMSKQSILLSWSLCQEP